MAPANVARASTSTDSVRGLAQAIAKPAYRRLLSAEPALRRAVPLLIITFLVTMAVGTAVQVLDQRRQRWPLQVKRSRPLPTCWRRALTALLPAPTPTMPFALR